MKPSEKAAHQQLSNSIESEMKVNFLGRMVNANAEIHLTADLGFYPKLGRDVKFNMAVRNYTFIQTNSGGWNDTSSNLNHQSDSIRKLIAPKLKGFQYQGNLSHEGRLLDIDDNKKQMTAFLAQFGQKNIDSAIRHDFGPIKNEFSSEGIGNFLSRNLNVFPRHPVNVGDEWRTLIELKSVFPGKIDARFRLLKIEDSIAEISMKGQIRTTQSKAILTGLALVSSNFPSSKISPSGYNLNYDGLKMYADLEGTQEGRIWFDMRQGIVKKNEITQFLSGTLLMGPFNLPLEFKMHGVFELSPQKP